MPGVDGAVEERFCWPYLSGGDDAVYRGDVIFRCECCSLFVVLSLDMI